MLIFTNKNLILHVYAIYFNITNTHLKNQINFTFLLKLKNLNYTIFTLHDMIQI